MKLARTWDTESEWTVGTVRSELLDAWLHEDHQDPTTLDTIWADLQHARQMLDRVDDEDFSHALADLYCAAYRWHLACTSPTLSSDARHRQAEASAMDEVRSNNRLMQPATPGFTLRWCS